MKSTSLFIAAATFLIIGACGQDKDPVVEVSEEAAVATEEVAAEVADAVEEVAEAFSTAELIDPNTASVDVIAAIPPVGTELAEQIVAGRPYATPSELHAVLNDVVSENELKTIYSAMFVKVDLNTGNNADYQLIPTTLSPRKLAHEFEEYRPYESMDQFSREMSKYVSDEEVAFLRRYVTID